ncbi:MAG: PASTA domain-containing protein [Acidobacteria bacterium]|nr:PASTA domain-containing protein [Acidobacteriota bacterium]
MQQGVTVPSVVGQPQSDAEKTLKRSELDVGEITLRSDDRVGIVLEQSPKAGKVVDLGTAVDLVVGRKDSDDGETISVPDLRGLELEPAQEMLATLKLKLGDITRQAGTDDGTVLDQSPAPGALAAPEAFVTLVVSVRSRLSRNQMVARFEEDQEFEGLGLTAEEIKERLATLAINSLGKIKRLAAQSNASIRRNLKLKNNDQVEVFRRLVTRLLPTPS